MGSLGSWTREGVRQALLRRFYTRFHMSLILASSALAAMLANSALHAAGVTSMLARYPVAIAASYAVFLAGVWLWLHYIGVRRIADSSSSALDGADLANLPVPSGSGSPGTGIPGIAGRGGGFDGGGASAAWAEGPGTGAAGSARVPVVTAAGDGGDKGLGALADGVDGDFVLLLLAIALVVAIFAASGYLVWFAPDILAEAAFGALLAGGLARRSRKEDAAGWLAGVVRKTWWPFAMVLVIAMIFAAYAGHRYPEATTVREAFSYAAR